MARSRGRARLSAMARQARHSRLSEEDLKRVEEYLASPVHRVERKPFRPWLLLFWLWVVVSALGLFSWWLGHFYGLV
ncbi:MAG: hypothetical protein KatS3mg124_0391 [Porticoccaceae bacterium]|nr:MAG: hypothetical protein KatS3mg124_0391 [Porticoccaceae bacterium]